MRSTCPPRWKSQNNGHAHLHVYFNSDKVSHRNGPGALDIFTFENISPHVVPNRASGGAYAGAVRHGHVYVVVDKIGSRFTWTDYTPFKDYAAEGWWIGNLLKQQKS